MKQTICRLLGLASTAILLGAHAPLSGDPSSDNARPSAQQAETTPIPAPTNAQVVAAEAEAAHAPRDPGSLIKSMLKITDADRIGVKAGLIPASVLNYDAQLIRMMVTTPATLEEHQRDPTWTKRKHALFVARDAAIQAHTDAVVQRNQQEAQMYNNTAQLYGGLSDQQRKDAANRDAAHQDYLNRLGAVSASPDCVVVHTESWTGCSPQ